MNSTDVESLERESERARERERDHRCSRVIQAPRSVADTLGSLPFRYGVCAAIAVTTSEALGFSPFGSGVHAVSAVTTLPSKRCPEAPNWSQHRIPSPNQPPISMGTK